MDKTPVKLKKRILILGTIFSFAFMAMVCRLVYVQVIWGAELQEKAFDQHTRDRNITQTRGSILDRNGNVIAQNSSVLTIGVVRAQVEDPVHVATILSEKLGLNYDKVYQNVTKRVSFQRIATKVDQEVAAEISALNLPGVKVDEDSERHYPYEELAAPVVGFVGKDNQGIVGLEVVYDKYLKGEPGQILMETQGDGTRREDEAEVRIEPVNGNHLVTTLDITLQEYTQQIIDRVVDEKQAKSGSIVLMNPKNGEIYSMASSPTFNLNDPFSPSDPKIAEIWDTLSATQKQNELNKMWRNPPINDTYEPGSTFKVFTSAMGLDKGLITPDTPFNCTGSLTVGGHTIKCWRHKYPHGDQTFTQGVQNSCNPVFMHVGEWLGADNFYTYMVRFGFMEKTGIDLPGEAKGIMHKQEKIGPVELATMSFGQSFQITPMQLLSAASSVVNGGYEITPHFGKQIIDENGNVVEVLEFNQGTQIITPEVSSQLKTILESVVSEGTGNKSYIPGYSIGGKTATSQKLPRGSGKYIASFMAFAPADDPIVIGIVMIDEPKGVYYGGAIAGPIMKEVMSNTLPYLGVEPKYTEQEQEMPETQVLEVPNFIGMDTRKAKDALYALGVTPEVEGTGTTVVDQFPTEGQLINRTSKIILYTQ
ncbi:peptidoglycan glycosyltransferase [Candidatus Epulonipiscium fishelsonii]|uniref:Peptidoglycan glycosyltransferase n=1 Tax=Candidatus Epulonipiscium fishelsonii TaxID=77094 RepID=A0ACC8XFL0_9FIRM|nr:peptidoglycan glycosyltransferase [Epulopiscium sp. SCG-B11WGA-EpuloA1]